MSYAVSNAFSWLAGAIYVIIALAIVYLYFFKLVPTVFNSVSTWTLGAVIQVTLVLAAVAILLGGVAVFTADWIFTQVLTSLPNTRIAYEINRVTGSVVQLPTQGYGPPSPGGSYGSYTAPPGSGPPPYASGASSGPTVLGSGTLGSAPGSAAPSSAAPGSAAPGSPAAGAPASAAESEARRLKSNALEIWASTVQEVYNPTGNISDNTNVMSKRDIPQGVQCDVFAVANGIWTKRYEDWNLACSDDGFRDVVTITVNGTAARGLTGGKFYSAENPLPVFGTGLWPEMAFEPAPPSAPAAPTPTPSNSSSSDDDSAGSDTPVSNASSATSGASATPAAGGPHTHTVESGESLASIANQYDVSVQGLINHNIQRYPALQENPNVIRAGWTLTIPAQ